MIPTVAGWRAAETARVLADVGAHRAEQRARYGDNADLPDGTGPEVAWLRPVSLAGAELVEERFRDDYNSHGVVAPSWMHLVREEVAEAFQESDPVRLRAELVQVAALCVSWCETLDAR